MSMVGYILGLGDRHPSNLMLDRYTGKVSKANLPVTRAGGRYERKGRNGRERGDLGRGTATETRLTLGTNIPCVVCESGVREVSK